MTALDRFGPAGMRRAIGKIGRFYAGGFREMTLGRTLWTVILVKALVLFGILKLLFFHDYLDTRFDRDEQKSEYVLEQLIAPPASDASSQGRDDE